MLWTLSSEALRRGAGQLRITWFPRCTPDRSSVRCGTLSTGGCGGRRLPHAANVKAKGRRQKAKIRREEKFLARRPSALLPSAFCLLPSAFREAACLLPFAFIRGRSG